MVFLPVKQINGALESFACIDCAKKSGVYCLKHESPHVGFEGDKSTACLCCIDEEVQHKKKDAPLIVERLLANLPTQEFKDIDEVAEISSRITENSKAVCILRFIVTMAQRRNRSVEDIIEETISKKSALVILWYP
jgi:hypothetical protein